MKVLLPAIAIIFLFSCTDTYDNVPENVQAFVPVYADTNHLAAVTFEASRPVTNAGKIYSYGNYIFQNEENEGIHIIDNTDRTHPVKKAFLTIPFNSEIAIKAGYLYANRLSDLLVINMTDPLHPAIVKTIKNAFPFISQTVPPEAGYFVCPDPQKGVVINWKLEFVDKVFCRK
jgi:hypothetical protein